MYAKVDGLYDRYRVETAELAKGGVGTIYKTTDSSLVYKRYLDPAKAPDRANLDNLVRLGRDVTIARGLAPGATPESSINWPIDIVPGPGGTVRGVILPAIPTSMLDPSTGKPRGLDFLILARAQPPRAKARVAILLRLAEILTYLDGVKLVHGDINYKNVVWTLSPTPMTYLIDCDGLLPQEPPPAYGVSALGWNDPRLTEGLIPAHDHHSDWYALALAIYRGLTLAPGNITAKTPQGTWPKPSKIPPALDRRVAALLHQALDDPVNGVRPSPSQWVQALLDVFIPNGAYNETALDQLDATTPKPPPAFAPIPPIPPTLTGTGHAPTRNIGQVASPVPATPARTTWTPSQTVTNPVTRPAPVRSSPTLTRRGVLVAGSLGAIAVCCLAFVDDLSRMVSEIGDAPEFTPTSTPADPNLLAALTGHNDDVPSVAWSPDGRRIASVDSAAVNADRTVKIWDVNSRQATRTIVDPRKSAGFIIQSAKSVAWSPDGSRLAIGAHHVTIWDTNTWEIIHTFETGTGAELVAFSPDGNRLAFADGSLYVWNIGSGNWVGWHDLAYNINSLSWMSNTRIVTCRGDTATLWSVENDQFDGRARIHTFGHSSAVNSVACSPDATRLATACDDGIAKIWNLDTGQEILTLADPNAADLNTVAWSHNATRLAIGSSDGHASIWDASTGKRLQAFALAGEVRSVAWSPDSTRLATGSDEVVRIWRADIGSSAFPSAE